jgi:hypothetical protein
MKAIWTSTTLNGKFKKKETLLLQNAVLLAVECLLIQVR